MSRRRQVAKKVLPGPFRRWILARRTRILELAGGGRRISPGVLARASWSSVAPVRTFSRRAAVRVLPDPVVDRLRRRRLRKRYLKALSYELLEGETRLEYLEGRVAARRDGFYQRIVKDVLERTELVLQELDRRIEGLSARSGERLNAVEEQLVQLREEIGRLHRLSEPALEDLDARARAEGTPAPGVELAGDGADEAASATGVAGPADAEPSPDGSGNGRIPAPEHAATSAE